MIESHHSLNFSGDKENHSHTYALVSAKYSEVCHRCQTMTFCIKEITISHRKLYAKKKFSLAKKKFMKTGYSLIDRQFSVR